MSGGYWSYEDAKIDSEVNPEHIPIIMKALRKAFHEVDWAESCDTSKEYAAPIIYDIIKELGNEIFD